MNWKQRLVAFSGACVISLWLPAVSGASTIYSYFGSAYNTCSGLYGTSPPPACAAPYALHITFTTSLSGAQLENLTWGSGGTGNILATVTSFVASDGGGVAIFDEDSNLTVPHFSIATDGTGNITVWQMAFTRNFSTVSFQAQSFGGTGGGGVDSSITQTSLGRGEGSITYGLDARPGVWTRVGAPDENVSQVPEPATLGLLSLGLVGMSRAIRRRRSTGAAKPRSDP